MPAAPGGPPSTESARRAVEAVWRIESARIVGALARYTGDFALAEDVAQEAVAEALVTWSRDGAPANPVGWLLATAAARHRRLPPPVGTRRAVRHARRPARRG
jgi:predicted RNA polymerase sigma factor